MLKHLKQEKEFGRKKKKRRKSIFVFRKTNALPVDKQKFIKNYNLKLKLSGPLSEQKYSLFYHINMKIFLKKS